MLPECILFPIQPVVSVEEMKGCLFEDWFQVAPNISTRMTELLRGLGMSEFCSIATIRIIYISYQCVCITYICENIYIYYVWSRIYGYTLLNGKSIGDILSAHTHNFIPVAHTGARKHNRRINATCCVSMGGWEKSSLLPWIAVVYSFLDDIAY